MYRPVLLALTLVLAATPARADFLNDLGDALGTLGDNIGDAARDVGEAVGEAVSPEPRKPAQQTQQSPSPATEPSSAIKWNPPPAAYGTPVSALPQGLRPPALPSTRRSSSTTAPYASQTLPDSIPFGRGATSQGLTNPGGRERIVDDAPPPRRAPRREPVQMAAIAPLPGFEMAPEREAAVYAPVLTRPAPAKPALAQSEGKPASNSTEPPAAQPVRNTPAARPAPAGAQSPANSPVALLPASAPLAPLSTAALAATLPLPDLNSRLAVARAMPAPSPVPLVVAAPAPAISAPMTAPSEEVAPPRPKARPAPPALAPAAVIKVALPAQVPAPAAKPAIAALPDLRAFALFYGTQRGSIGDTVLRDIDPTPAGINRELINRVASDLKKPGQRVRLHAQALADAGHSSQARLRAYERARLIKSWLEAAGVRPTQIDLDIAGAGNADSVTLTAYTAN